MRKNKLAILYVVVLAALAYPSVGNKAGQLQCTGRVVDTHGQPIAGAEVRLYEMVYDQTAYSFDTKLTGQVTTQADGAFSFSTSAESDGYRYGYALAEKEGLALGLANWNMREGNKEFQIKLSQAKELAGVVVDENGKPIAQAAVSIYMLLIGEGEDRQYLTGTMASELLTVSTDAAGKFAFANLPLEATAEFLVKKPGRATVATLNMGNYQAQSLQFSPGQSDIRLTQPVEAKVEGIVVEKKTGKPVAGVKLILMQDGNRPAQEACSSNEDGTFNIDALSAAKYILQLVAQMEKLAEWVAEPVEVTTEAGKTKSGVKIELTKGGILEVVVTDAVTKQPVEKASVSIRNELSSQYHRGYSEKNGVARIRLMPGKYQMSGPSKQGYATERRQEPITIEEGKTERIQYELAGQPKIVGVVRDEKGRPVEGVKLKICPMGREDATSDAEGKFEVSWDPGNGPSGEIPVMFLVCRYEKGNLAAALEVEEDTKTLDIKLEPGVIITARVMDPDGKGIEGAAIQVNLRESRWGSPIARDIAKTDAQGNIEVRGVPAEHKYNVYARAEGYGENSVEVHTDDAVDNHLDVGVLTLAVANLSVSGVVVDADDKPVPSARISAYGEGQPRRYNIRTDAQGRFTVDKICAGRIRISASTSGKTRLYGSVYADGGASDVKIEVSERPSTTRYVPKQPPSLVRRPLPELKDLQIELSPADTDDKMILVCFWDMNQRPSRHCISELAKRAEELKTKGVTVVAVQASEIDENALNQWVKNYNISFPVGMVRGDAEKMRFAWGVRSLPWLILTDQKHIVRAEGFGLGELGEKIDIRKKTRGSGIDTIPDSEMTWVKCANKGCGTEYQMGLKEYHKAIEKRLDPMAMTAPPLVCKKCGEESIYRAEKCENPDCGIVFFRGAVPNDFRDRCPKCGYSATEESRKRRMTGR